MSDTALRHAGRVTDKGVLILADPSAWRRAVARHRDRAVWVSIVRQQDARTLSQNRYYWGVVVRECAEYCGLWDEEMHDKLKRICLQERVEKLLDGRELTVPLSTRRLSVEEFAAYVERCKEWAATFLGLALPEANQIEATL